MCIYASIVGEVSSRQRSNNLAGLGNQAVDDVGKEMNWLRKSDEKGLYMYSHLVDHSLR